MNQQQEYFQILIHNYETRKMKQFSLHVGMHKSGTTFIQSILANNRRLLLKHGWVYPLGGRNQQIACYGINGDLNPWTTRFPVQRLQNQSRKLLKEISSNKNKNLIVSAEVLSVLNEEGIKNFIENVGKPTKVIFTVRRLGKTLPSAWQQYLKKGQIESLDDFLIRLEKIKTKQAHRQPWAAHAYGDCIERWKKACDAEITSLILDPDDQTATGLLDTFTRATSLPGSMNTDFDNMLENTSLSLNSAEVLRKLNVFSREHLDNEQRQALNDYLLQDVLFDPFFGSDRITLTNEWKESIENWDAAEYLKLQKHSNNIFTFTR